MASAFRRRNRYERRSLARQRRIQRRLEEVETGGVRRARPQRRLSRGARVVVFAASLLLGLGLARALSPTVASWLTSRPAPLTAVAVQGTARLSGDEVARSLGLARGEDLSGISTEEIAARLREHPWIRSARVAILPTGTLIVDVEERLPRAVRRGGGDELHFVDGDGESFAAVRPHERDEAATLPAFVAPPSDAGAEAAAQPAMADTLALLERLRALRLPGLARPDLPHRGLALELPADVARGWVLRCEGRDTEVILGSDGVAAVSERLERLERLLSAGLGELEGTKSIDLRFAGQAVLRTESASG